MAYLDFDRAGRIILVIDRENLNPKKPTKPSFTPKQKAFLTQFRRDGQAVQDVRVNEQQKRTARSLAARGYGRLHEFWFFPAIFEINDAGRQAVELVD